MRRRAARLFDGKIEGRDIISISHHVPYRIKLSLDQEDVGAGDGVDEIGTCSARQ